MGFYERNVLPKIMDKMTSLPALARLRPELLASARGRVLEIGFGTGHNAPHYPRAVEHVVGLDSNPGVEKLARRRIAAATVPIELQLCSAERLPFPDASFDTIVTALVLCSIADLGDALAEMRRVLAPGGRYLMIEHGLADDPKAQKWQHRLNGFNGFMMGGCRLNRPVVELVQAAGFRFETKRQFYQEGAPRWAGYMTLGSAAAS